MVTCLTARNVDNIKKNTRYFLADASLALVNLCQLFRNTEGYLLNQRRDIW